MLDRTRSAERVVAMSNETTLRNMPTVKERASQTLNRPHLLQIAADAMPMPVVIAAAPDWRLVYANPAANEAAGGRSLIGRAIVEEMQAAGPAAKRLLDEARTTGRVVSRRAQAMPTESNPRSWWDFDHVPIAGGSADIDHVMVVARDVTPAITAQWEAKAASENLGLARRALADAEERLRLAQEAAGIGIWEVDFTRGLASWNSTVGEMLGFIETRLRDAPAPLLALVHPSDRRGLRAAIERARIEQGVISAEFRVTPQNGRELWLAAQGRVFAEPNERAVGVVRDITARKRRELELEAALEARVLLGREADHRIKNSLQLVASLLQLQRSRMTDTAAAGALDDAIARVKAVGEAHRALQHSADLRTVPIGTMLRDLGAQVSGLNPFVTLDCDVPDLDMDTERAIPLALLASELLTNAARHAFPDGRSGTVRVSATRDADSLTVVISDDGAGMKPDAGGRNSLGTSIIQALSRQIGAECTVASEFGSGTRVEIRVPA